MPATQCPKCELRFAFPTEVAWHLREEHRPAPVPSESIRIVTSAARNGESPSLLRRGLLRRLRRA